MIAASIASTLSCRVRAADLRPHITAIAYSRDGKQLLCGSQAGVSIRNASDGVVDGEIDAEMESVNDVRFSPDGQLLAIAGGVPGESGMVELRHWPDLGLRQRVEPHGDVVYQVDFTPDGKKLLSASADEVCSVHSIDDNRTHARFTQHSRAVLSVKSLPGGEFAVSASRDETLSVWSTNSGEKLRTLHNHSRAVHALALKSEDGKLPLVASASSDATVRFWQPTIGRMVRFARLPSVPLSIAWVDDGHRLVAGCRDGVARLIDPISVSITNSIEVSDQWIYAIAVNPSDNHRIAIGGSRGLVETFSVRPKTES